MTLIEVTLAAAMLAIIAATCMPLIVSSVQTIHRITGRSMDSAREHGTSRTLDLDAIAQAITADPSRFGLPTLEDLHAVEVVDLTDVPSNGTVTVHLLRADSQDLRRGWLVVSELDTNRVAIHSVVFSQMPGPGAGPGAVPGAVPGAPPVQGMPESEGDTP